MMTQSSEPSRNRPDSSTLIRLATGLIWLAGALFNTLVILRMDDPWGWAARDAHLRPYRWFFSLVGKRPRFWTIALILFETAIGCLTLGKGARARFDLIAGAAFSLFLFPILWPYTAMMGPYALLLAWLQRRTPDVSLLDLLQRARRR